MVTAVKNLPVASLFIMSHFLGLLWRYELLSNQASWCYITREQVDLAGDAPVFKEGEIYRKNVMEGPNKKGSYVKY